MPFLRQSTTQTIRFGPFLDATDGVTEETGLTITQALRRISKDGGAFAQSNHTGNSVHDSDGWYSDDLNATDTNTVGELILNIQDPANHLPVFMRYWVLEEAIYDALFGASAAGFDGNQDVTVGGTAAGAIVAASFGAGAINAAAIASDAITNAKIANNAIGATEIATDAITADKIASDAITSAKIAAGAITASEAPNLDAAISTRATPAQVNTEVLDVFTVDTFAEPSGVPAATATLEDKINWLCALARNKITQTNTLFTLRNDADAADIATASVSDDGTTFTRGEYS